jgi:hypothetical protein
MKWIMKMKLAQDFANKRHFRFHNMASKYQMTGSCNMFVVHLTMLSVSSVVG